MDQYIRKNNYETTSFDGEWVILNTDNYTITRLNETGGFCWSLLSEAQSVHSLSRAVSQKFGAEIQGCRRRPRNIFRTI